MKVNVNGEKYVVAWRYTRHFPPFFKFIGITYCYIKLFNFSDKKGDWGEEIVASDSAKCSVMDQFCKDVGRKISLKRALVGFDKNIRGAFWHAYLHRNEEEKSEVA